MSALEKAKILSPYTGETYELEVMEKEENGNVLKIISHNSLERLVNDVLSTSEYYTEYSFNFIECSKQHTVVVVTVSDAKGRTVSDVGESLLNQLETSISKKYPSLIAAQRAFDRAVIKYLQFSGKVYSSLEIPQEEFMNDDIVVFAENLPEMLEVEPQTQEKTEEIQEETEEKTTVDATTKEKTEVTIAPEPEKEVADSSINDIVVDMGKYRGKNKKISEIYEEDKGWFNWMCQYNKTEVGDIMREYKKEKEI